MSFAIQAQNTAYFTHDRSKAALSHAMNHLNDNQLDQFVLGRSFFTVPWVEAPAATTARDGLGPLFNANNCVSCHKNNGGGESSTRQQGSVSRSIVFTLSQSNTEKDQPSPKGDPIYGSQLAINGIHGVPFEGKASVHLTTTIFTYPDHSSVTLTKPNFTLSHLNYGALAPNTTINARRALSLTGLGLIEQIPSSQILNHQDINDDNGDGISGKANRIWSEQAQQFKLGRFGWKASSALLIDQTAKAFINDIGITSPLFSEETCSLTQSACNSAHKTHSDDLPMLRLKAVTLYISRLKVPKAPKMSLGKKLFIESGCEQCHQNNYRTDSGIVVNPYSDFLLHDMGKELADQSNVFLATGNEWRTPPLWGIGLAKKLNHKAGYLHDGRANTIEQAILWHGGEALPSQQAFVHLHKKNRSSLLKFLSTL